MPAFRDAVMKALYGSDIYLGFQPSPDAEMQGWNGDHPSLSRLAGLPGPKLIVDVGVWKGMSTINMALALKRSSIDGCVIAVDTFLGSSEHWKGGAYSGLFERRNGLPNLYSTFLSNVTMAGVADYVVPMPQTSTIAATILGRMGFQPDLVHIDAAHDYEDVIRDASDYYAFLKKGGHLIGDDYSSYWPGVVRAAAELSMTHRVPLAIEPPKWILQKPD